MSSFAQFARHVSSRKLTKMLISCGESTVAQESVKGKRKSRQNEIARTPQESKYARSPAARIDSLTSRDSNVTGA